MPRLLQSSDELAGELLCAIGRPVMIGGSLLPPITPGALSLLDAFGSPIIHATGDEEPDINELIASLLVWLEGPRATQWRGYIPVGAAFRHAFRIRKWKRRSAIGLWADAHRHVMESLSPMGMVHNRHAQKKTVDTVPDGTPRYGIDWLRNIAAGTLRAGFAASFHDAAWNTPLMLACHAWAATAQRNGCSIERPLDADASREFCEQYEADHAEELAATRARLKELSRHG